MKRPSVLTLLALTALGGMGLSQATQPVTASKTQVSSLQSATLSSVPSIILPGTAVYMAPMYTASPGLVFFGQQACVGGLPRISNEMFNGPAGPQANH